MNASTALVACDVFQNELASLLAGGAGSPPSRVEWLEMGLHDHADRMKKAIQEAIDRIESDPAVTTILLAYGLCGNGVIGIRTRHCRLVLPRAHDCISVLFGDRSAYERYLAENPGVYFYSPGWIRGRRVPGPDRDASIRAHYQQRYPDDPEVVEDMIAADRETYAHHGCAAYIDVTDDTTGEDYCRSCARHLGWRFEKIRGDDRWLRTLLSGPWDSPHFVVLEAGRPTQLGPDGMLAASGEPTP
ncbi:MAG TPA: DUF1638 domain-containing protein [Opitutaceae bacterium]|nr:DUF1638 domain-containing protein [Opitutaceae bacterium]